MYILRFILQLFLIFRVKMPGQQTSIKSFFHKAEQSKGNQTTNNNFNVENVVFESDYRKKIKQEVFDNLGDEESFTVRKIKVENENFDYSYGIKIESNSDPKSNTRAEDNNQNIEDGLNEFSSESEIEMQDDSINENDFSSESDSNQSDSGERLDKDSLQSDSELEDDNSDENFAAENTKICPFKDCEEQFQNDKNLSSHIRKCKFFKANPISNSKNSVRLSVIKIEPLQNKAL